MKNKIIFSQTGFFCLLIEDSSRTCIESYSNMFSGWQPIPRSNALKPTMSSLYYSDQMVCSCISAFCTFVATVEPVSNRLILTESEQGIAFLSNFMKVSDMSIQQYLAFYGDGHLSTHSSICRQKNPVYAKIIVFFIKLEGFCLILGPPLMLLFDMFITKLYY